MGRSSGLRLVANRVRRPSHDVPRHSGMRCRRFWPITAAALRRICTGLPCYLPGPQTGEPIRQSLFLASPGRSDQFRCSTGGSIRGFTPKCLTETCPMACVGQNSHLRRGVDVDRETLKRTRLATGRRLWIYQIRLSSILEVFRKAFRQVYLADETSWGCGRLPMTSR